MSFLTEEQINSLRINRMIFHIVGKSLPKPKMLNEIVPPAHTDFFLERIKSSLKGNLFKFREHSLTEKSLRKIKESAERFTLESKKLVNDFQRWHTGKTSTGAFFLFELGVDDNQIIYALIKYDNEDVVRYLIRSSNKSQAPKLERFSESFVRKAEAMQKIALIRLNDSNHGGSLVVCDRSNRTHISGFFEGFLDVQRVNSSSDLSGKLVEVLKEVFKLHRTILPEDIQKSGVNRIYDTLRQPGQVFDAENIEPLITAIFGPTDVDSVIRKSLARCLKNKGIAEESFNIDPARIQKPTRRKIVTQEGVEIIYDEGMKPEIKDRPDGRKEIIVITSQVTRDDIDTGKN